MKVYADRIHNELKKGLAPVYLISGDETLLVNECADAIRATCKQQGFSERELFHTDSPGFDWEQVIQSMNSMSLFAERKLVEIRCPKQKPNHKTLLDYVQQPNPDTVLLIISAKLDASSQRTKWFKSLESKSLFIPVWPLEGQALGQWLNQRCQKAGLNLNSGALQILQDRIEGNLLAASQEIEKLRLLFDDQPIDETRLTEAVTDSARYNVFALTDKALLGDAAGTLKILQGLRDEGTAETAILWALTRELRILISTRLALDSGEQINWALKKQGVWEKRQPLFQQALKRLPLQHLHQLLKQASQIDLSIKGMAQHSPWNELQDLCMQLCRPQT